jgi:hypothetical protein
MTPKQLRKHKAKVEQARLRLADGTTTTSKTPTKMAKGARAEANHITELTVTGRACRQLKMTHRPIIYGHQQFYERNIDGNRNIID